MLFFSNPNFVASPLTIGGDVTLTRSAANTLTIQENVVITAVSGGAGTPLTVNADGSQSVDTVIIAGTPPSAADRALLRLGAALSGGNANGTWLAVNAAASSGKDLIAAVLNNAATGFYVRGDGSGGLRVGIGAVPTAGKFTVTGTGNNETDGTVTIKNVTDGTASGAGLSITSGTSNAANGYFFAYCGGYTAVGAFTDRVVLGASANASNGIALYAAAAGQMVQIYGGSATAAIKVIDGRACLRAPNTAPTDADLQVGSIEFYLDESGHNLKVRAKYADGTLKLATVALA